MAQTAATMWSDDGAIDYTPGSAVTAGDVVVLGSIVGVATNDIAANAKGSLTIDGVFKVPKITGAISVGTKLYWDPAGTPVTGDASSGAATATAGSLKVMGYAVLAAASGDSYVYIDLQRA